MKKTTYIIIKDNTRRNPEKTTTTNVELAHLYFNNMVDDGFYPVAYAKTPKFFGLFHKTRRLNWDKLAGYNLY